MKVVFLEDVTSVAEAGEVKEVADGYGRNFLIPRKLAVLADGDVTNSTVPPLWSLHRTRTCLFRYTSRITPVISVHAQSLTKESTIPASKAPARQLLPSVTKITPAL